MEEEIDLRAYVGVLIHHWMWIAALTIVAAVAAFVVSLFLPPTYEAPAVVIITQPRYQMQFDPRFKTIDQWTPAYKAFPTLATSDGVLRDVLGTHTPSAEAGVENWTLRTLSQMVEASSEGDPSLVVLRVRSHSPEDAAAIANLWADALATRGNRLYSDREDDVAFFDQQATQAKQTLDKADLALVEFEARSQANTINAQLESLLQAQADYLADQRAIASITQDIDGMRTQLAQQPGDRPISLADDLTALLLQIKAFNLLQVKALDAQVSTPIQLQVNSAESFSDKSPAEQIDFLDGLVATLETKSSEIDGRMAELEPQVLKLQRQLQEITAEGDRLMATRELASETHMTLVRKLEEARISAQEHNGVLQVGSYAAVPERPVAPRKMLNTAVAGVLGLMIAVFGAFAIEWWQGGAQGSTPESGEKDGGKADSQYALN